MTIVKFEVGKTYQNRRTGDHNQIVSIKVLSRTEKTLRAETDEGAKTLRISLHNGVEQVKPEGSHSMAPIVSATGQAVTKVCQGYWLRNGAGFFAMNESASMWTHIESEAYLYGVGQIGAALDRVRLADPKAASIAVFGPL
jgi:hypothetical protein